MEQKQCCQLCDEEETILKDAEMTEYCALCSMTVENNSIKTIKFKQGVKYFCSKKCKDKLEKIYTN